MVSVAQPVMPGVQPAIPAQPRIGDRAPGRVAAGDDDAALITAVAGGDPAALDQLYLRYRPVAFAAAYGLLRDAAAAEDAVHDAFLRVWRSAASFQAARGVPRGWLLAIVRNAAIDAIRARQLARRPQTAQALQALQPAAADDVATIVVAGTETIRLRAALGTLPPAQRDAVELAYFAGLTHNEIAARLGVPLGTVKGRLRLGLRRLRLELAERTPGPDEPCARHLAAAH